MVCSSPIAGPKQFSLKMTNYANIGQVIPVRDYLNASYNNSNFTEYYTYDYYVNSSEYPDNGLEDDFGLTVAYKIGDFLTHYYTPAMVAAGSIGNILSVIVFFNTKLKKLSSSYYLAAMCISDTGFLWASLVPWLNYVNIDLYNRDYFCQSLTYISGLCSFLSVWFVVGFTVERFIAVRYPLKRQTMCTVKRARLTLAALILIGSIICIPYLLYAAPVYSEDAKYTICDVREEYKLQMQVFNYIDTIIVFVIPFTLIVVLNSFTSLAVWKFGGVRRSMTMERRLDRRMRPTHQLSKEKEEYTSRANYPNVQPNDAIQFRKVCKNTANASQAKVTKMLLIVSTAFVCLNLPSYTLRIVAFHVVMDSTRQSQAIILTQYISWFFFFTNFGINFLLYCLSGQNFRKAVFGMFAIRRNNNTRKQDNGATQVTVTEYLRNSNSLTSSKRRLATKNDSIAFDLPEFQYGNGSSF